MQAFSMPSLKGGPPSKPTQPSEFVVTFLSPPAVPVPVPTGTGSLMESLIQKPLDASQSRPGRT